MSKQGKKRVKENLSPSIAQRCRELNIKSVAELAARCNIPAPTLYGCLGKNTEMSLRTASKLALGLGWSLEHLAFIYFAENPCTKSIPGDSLMLTNSGRNNNSPAIGNNCYVFPVSA